MEPPQKKAVIYKKHVKFINERNEILHKIYNILNLTEAKKSFYVYDIDNDINKQNEIIELAKIIPTYFKVSTWIYFKKNITVEKPILSLVKCVFRAMNKKYTSLPCNLVINDNKIVHTTIYILKEL